MLGCRLTVCWTLPTRPSSRSLIPVTAFDSSSASDPHISVVGRPHWSLLKEFYTTNALVRAGSRHRLLYKRALRNPSYTYVASGRRFAWGWWSTQWTNMLRATNDTRDEEDAFVTLELFAYSSPSANRLSVGTVSDVRSSRLVPQLLAQIARYPPRSPPRRIVLVNKRSIWEPLLQQFGITFVELAPRNRAGIVKAFRGQAAGRPTEVPLIFLNGAQGMKFPQGADSRAIFGP